MSTAATPSGAAPPSSGRGRTGSVAVGPAVTCRSSTTQDGGIEAPRPQSQARLAAPARLAALERTGALGLSGDKRLGLVTQVAAQLLGVDASMVSLVTDTGQDFPASTGLEEPWTKGTDLSHSFCQHVVLGDGPLEVDDAERDPRVADNLAIEDLGVRAYLGVPLRSTEGHVLGAMCVVTTSPRAWSDDDLRLLDLLAGIVRAELLLRTLDGSPGDERADLLPAGHALRENLHASSAALRLLALRDDVDAATLRGLAGLFADQTDQSTGWLDRLEVPEAGVTQRVDLAVALQSVIAPYRRLGAQVDDRVEDGLVVRADEVLLRRSLDDLLERVLGAAGDRRVTVIGRREGDRRVVVQVRSGAPLDTAVLRATSRRLAAMGGQVSASDLDGRVELRLPAA